MMDQVSLKKILVKCSLLTTALSLCFLSACSNKVTVPTTVINPSASISPFVQQTNINQNNPVTNSTQTDYSYNPDTPAPTPSIQKTPVPKDEIIPVDMGKVLEDHEKLVDYKNPAELGLKSVKLSTFAQKVFERVNNNSKESKSTIKMEFIATGGNKFLKSYVDGQEIFTAYKDLISKAKYEVNLLTFIWQTGTDAERSIGEGLKIAQENVQPGKKLVVRIIANDIILDGNIMINKLHDSKKKWALDPSKIDLQLAIFPALTLGNLHSKYLIVDGKNLIVTGANVEKVHNFTPDIWHDTGYLFEGPVALTALKDFDEAWEEHVSHYECDTRKFMIDCLPSNIPATPLRDYFSELRYDQGISLIALTREAKGNLISNEIDNPLDQGWLGVFENAENNINIETPNINDDAFQNAVIEAVKRGVTVKIITGKGFNDFAESLPAQGGSNITVAKKLLTRVLAEAPAMKDKLQIKWYSKNGKEPIDGGGSNASHTKYLSSDQKITIIGSGNMDTQSWNHSREFNVLIDDPDSTLKIEKSFYNSDWEKGIRFVL